MFAVQIAEQRRHVVERTAGGIQRGAHCQRQTIAADSGFTRSAIASRFDPGTHAGDHQFRAANQTGRSHQHGGTGLTHCKTGGIPPTQQPVAGDVMIDNRLRQQAFDPGDDLQRVTAGLCCRLRQQVRHSAAATGNRTAAGGQGAAQFARQTLQKRRLDPVGTRRAVGGGQGDQHRNLGCRSAQLFIGQPANDGQTFFDGGGQKVGQKAGSGPPLVGCNAKGGQVFANRAVPQIADRRSDQLAADACNGRGAVRTQRRPHAIAHHGQTG